MDKILLLLFEVGFGLNYNIVGEISISELFLLVSSIYYLRRTDFRNRDIRKIVNIYFLLIIIQCVTELIIGNSSANMAKGIAVSIMSFLHLNFLYYYLKRNRFLIVYIIVGMLLRSLVWGTRFEATYDISDSAFATFLKFYLAPLIINIGLIYSAIRYKRNLSSLFCVLGFFFVILGARSSGIITLITGIINYILTNKSVFRYKQYIKPILMVAVIAMYSLYCIYVQQIISGKITAGNSEQLLRVENPYNPVNLLMTGRTETFVGFIAFMDRPLTGWGAWANDPGMKYHILQSVIKNVNYNEADTDVDIIPVHSVLIGYGANNGIFAFICVLLLSSIILRRAITVINSRDKYNLILISFLFSFCWNIIFSPTSHFRYSLPVYMAFILVSYYHLQLKE